jgi:threonine aldolase
MIYFRSDYSLGAHPRVMRALEETNFEHTDGYGIDVHCENAARLVKELCGREDCAVHFMVGGTPCNVTLISAALRPYESAVSHRRGHAYIHETGGVEATGHRVAVFEGPDGKLTPELIDRAWDEYEDEHTTVPRLCYISQPTEIGTVYTKAEIKALFEKCRERDMYLYIDGARLGAALTCKGNDLSIKELARLCDAFYIGGTKNGALFGEALVINNPAINDHFRWMMKRQAGILAKGRLLGVQFEALLEGGENSIYYEMAAHSNRLADKLRDGLRALGVRFYSDSPTNQIFPVLPAAAVNELRKDFFFYDWAQASDGMQPVRLVTSWGTKDSDVDAFLDSTRRLLFS